MNRILLFIDSLGAGGAQRQLTGLACLLKEKGYSVKVATYYDHPFYKYLLDENQVEYECFRVNSKLCLPKLVRCIRRFKADVVISFQTDPNALACIAAKVCGTKLIVSERNTHQEINWKDRIIFQLYRLADYVVPNSYSEKNFIEKYFPHLKSKTQTIPNFVDLKRFSPTDRKEYNQGLLILSVASVKASKNTKNFIKAINAARNYEKSHEKLVIIAGACQSNYEELIKAGANYASSPKRVNIHALDPAIIAVTIALTERNKEINLKEMLEKTKYGKDGMGGIMGNGLMYVGYPR